MALSTRASLGISLTPSSPKGRNSCATNSQTNIVSPPRIPPITTRFTMLSPSCYFFTEPPPYSPSFRPCAFALLPPSIPPRPSPKPKCAHTDRAPSRNGLPKSNRTREAPELLLRRPPAYKLHRRRPPGSPSLLQCRPTIGVNATQLCRRCCEIGMEAPRQSP